ncbi:MAG: hypothetical protein ABJB16_17215 [Saprospiraceae bacterium]
MLRPVISYALTSLILLSQVGLPLHMHYCKGMLESVSVLFSAKCDDHNVPVNVPVCCQKKVAKHCDKKESKKCCDDQVLVLKQNITSTTPSFIKWIDISVFTHTKTVQLPAQENNFLSLIVEGNTCDSGPPIYILHQSLIFYA